VLSSSQRVLPRGPLGLPGDALLGVRDLASEAGEPAGQLSVTMAVRGGLLKEPTKSLPRIGGHPSDRGRVPYLVRMLVSGAHAEVYPLRRRTQRCDRWAIQYLCRARFNAPAGG
jgi:hypothetical protein